MVPVDDGQLRRGRGATGKAPVHRGDHVIERHVERGYPLRDHAADRVQIDGVTLPRERFAADAQADVDEAVDGAGGGVFARQPLGIKQRQRPRLDR